ncbi:hypothetical protein TNCV_4663151 [Trichonephila clavipes]|uniref:Uncharacterized protein n=1 Tax=Trichonephila clavipes TaxID=2585209 RepID=A0A8X6VDZ5_TRICX|nr:hypothetical protein TNCV_4663151 [Trichonephila clavipes]
MFRRAWVRSMDVCKCIVPLRYGGTLNSRQATSPLVRLVEGEERWEASDPPGCSPSKLGCVTYALVSSPLSEDKPFKALFPGDGRSCRTRTKQDSPLNHAAVDDPRGARICDTLVSL